MNASQKAGTEPTNKALDLVDSLTTGTWVDGALCRQVDPEVFFPERGDSNTVARTICGRCEVREECLEYVDRIEADMSPYDFHGIFAGMSRAERLSRREEKRLT